MTRVIVDADVIIKLSVLDLFWESLLTVEREHADFATLEAMRVSCGLRSDHVREKKTGSVLAGARLLKNLQSLSALDPLTDREEATATTIVAAAIKEKLPVDSGEATLMSVAIHRNLPFVTTGDLKAITSLQQLSASTPILARLTGRIVCFEELLCRTIAAHPFALTHPRLLAGRACDKWLDTALEEANSALGILQCIDVRLAALRRAAPGFLTPTQVHGALKMQQTPPTTQSVPTDKGGPEAARNHPS